MRIRRYSAIALLIIAVLAASAWGYLRWQRNAEEGRLCELLGITEGSVVAEIGAGDGSFTVTVGKLVGPGGRVYSTEIEEDKQLAIRAAAQAASLENIEVRQAGEDSTNLPSSCCDVVFLRHVYHHVSAPQPFVNSLFESTRPGGKLAVIDFPSGGLMGWLPAVDEVPEGRGAHGISPDLVVSELSAAGFEVIERIDDWYNVDFCVVARKPVKDEKEH
jgi:predicted methyltransferase